MLILCRNTFCVIIVVICFVNFTNAQGGQNRRGRPRVPSFSDILNDAVNLERAATNFDRAVQSGGQQGIGSPVAENVRIQVVPDQAESPFGNSADSSLPHGHQHTHNNNVPVITDVAGNVPPNPSGFHVDLPGEHGNTHNFPVIHRESSPISGDSHSHTHSESRPPPNKTPSVNGPPFNIPANENIGPSLVDIKTLNDEFSGVSVFQTPPESIVGPVSPVDLGSRQPDPSPLFPDNSVPPTNQGDLSNPDLSPGPDLGLGPIVLGSVPIDPFGNPITNSNPSVPVDVPIPADVGGAHTDHVGSNQGSHAHGGHNPSHRKPSHGHGRPIDIHSNSDHRRPDSHQGVLKDVPLVPTDPTKLDHHNKAPTDHHDSNRLGPGFPSIVGPAQPLPGVDHHDTSSVGHHDSNRRGPSIPSIIGPAPPLPGAGSSGSSGVFSGPHPVDVQSNIPGSHRQSHDNQRINNPRDASFGDIHTPNVLGPAGLSPAADTGIQIANGPMTPPPGLDLSNFGPDAVPNEPVLPVVPIGVAPGADNVPVPGRGPGRGRDWRERRRRWRNRRMRRRRNRRRRLRPAKEPVDVTIGQPFDPVSEPTDIIPEPGLPHNDIHHGKGIHNEPVPIPEIAHPEPTVDIHKPGRPEHKHVLPEPSPLPREKPFHENRGVTVHREPGHDGVRTGQNYEGRRRGSRGGLLGEIMRDAAQIRHGGVLNGPHGTRRLFPGDYGRGRENQVHITRSGPIPTNPTNPSPNRQGARLVISHRNVGNQLTQRLGNSIFNLLGRMLG